MFALCIPFCGISLSQLAPPFRHALRRLLFVARVGLASFAECVAPPDLPARQLRELPRRQGR